MTSKLQQRNNLRSSLRQQRKLLDEPTQIEHALSLQQQLTGSPLYRRSKRIAAYLAADGEIDPIFFIQQALLSKREIYLPVLAPFADRLYFAPYTTDQPMSLNRFGIAEPQVHPRRWLRAHQLDLILMPLVAFDPQGNRLGMGGGFYDRSLNFLRYRKSCHAPYLIGLAHQMQCVTQLEHQAHDVPMHLVATEQQLYQP